MANGDHDWTAGETVTAANVDDYLMLQAVMKFATSAARDSALTARKREGSHTYQDDSNCDTVYSGAAWSTIGPVHGALTAWTPVLTQSGAVTFSNVRSVYSRVGRQITGSFHLSVTGTGTASNVVTVSLPVTAVASTDLCFVGGGKIYDASAGFEYPAFVTLNSTTTMKYQIVTTGSVGSYLGTANFTAALASGDAVVGQFQYEAAGDA